VPVDLSGLFVQTLSHHLTRANLYSQLDSLHKLLFEHPTTVAMCQVHRHTEACHKPPNGVNSCRFGYSNACFFFYKLFFLILFGKNLDTFVMDFSRDRRKTPSADLENLLGHTYPFIKM
jgi:hypothetical protein